MSFYFAGRTGESKKIRIALAIGWLAKNGRKFLRRGLELPRDFEGDLTSNNFEDITNGASQLYGNFKAVRGSPLMRDFRKFLIRLVGGGALSSVEGHIPPDWISTLDSLLVGDTLPELITSLVIRVCQVAHSVRSGVSIMDAVTMSEWGDDDYVEMMDMMSNIGAQQDLHFVYQKLALLKKKTHRIAAHHKDKTVKGAAIVRFGKILEWEKVWRKFVHAGKTKPEPFVVTVFGSAGIGKTKQLHGFLDIVHELHRKHVGPIIQNVGMREAQDKYDSLLQTETTAIIVDDIGFNAPETYEDPPSVTVQRFVSSVTNSYLKAQADEKGTELNLAKFILITTNAFDGQCTWQTTDPDAATRRLGIMVEMTCKPEFMHLGKPNPRSFPPSDGGFARHATYRVYTIIQRKMTYLTESMESDALMRYLSAAYLTHVKRIVEVESRSYELCPACCLPRTNGCACIKLEPNLGFRPRLHFPVQDLPYVDPLQPVAVEARKSKLVTYLHTYARMYELGILHLCFPCNPPYIGK